MLRAILNGEDAPELVTAKTILELTATTYSVHYDGQEMDGGTYETISGAGPFGLILRGQSGTNKGRVIPCIYQTMGERLRVAYGLDEKTPADFTTAPGRSHYVAIYKKL
jgi:uncharacterized protein (TIGR03067 family)